MTDTSQQPTTWRKPGALTIERIETDAIRIPLDRIYRGSKYAMQNRCTIITRLFTQQGVVGEVYTGDTDAEQALIRKIIHEELAPALMGMDVFNTEGCWEAMKPATYDILRDRALVMQAIAAVDTAIWDTLGRALEMPLNRLWGGFTNRLPIIAIGGYYGQTHDELAAEIADYVAYGVIGMKFKIGGLTPQEDLERLKIARAVAGPDFHFMVDANQGYDLQQAITFVRLAQDAGITLRWFEEPVRWYNDRRWLRDVRLATGIPVTAGQSEHRIDTVRDLLASGAVDYCNFDTSWGGGPTIWRRVAAVASTYGVRMAHHEEAQVAGHLLSSIAHGSYVECFHRQRDPLFWELQLEPPAIQQGYYTISNRPGLGIQINPEYAARYRVS
ncbi:MAG: mandelate racemase/muconate lactonizing enzyme family protein [Anaerolineae bacterium]|nr:mandelate racemase/muconate lactonizing enzyme family protein [Anaerolineae bacterium]